MKNIKFLYLALIALVVGSLTACQEEWTPGEPDSAQSVYLPIDEENAVFPVGENVAEYPIYRSVAGPELQVEIRSRMLDEIFEGSDIFTFDEYVTFAEGETVAYLTITLREDLDLKVGEMYKADFKRLGLRDATSQYEHSGYGTAVKGDRWVMSHRVATDMRDADRCKVYIKRWLLDRRGYPKPTYRGGKYEGGYSLYLPVCLYFD